MTAPWGGHGPVFEASVAKLKERFPFRKWRVRHGEFCGAMYSQQDDGSIHMSMKTSVDKIKPATIPKGKSTEALLEAHAGKGPEGNQRQFELGDLTGQARSCRTDQFQSTIIS